MSREPSSPAHVFLQTQAQSPRPEPLSALFEPQPEPTSAPPALPYKRRSFTVRVEPKKKPRRPPRVTDEAGNSPTNRALGRKRPRPMPKRDPYATRWSDLTPAEMASFVIYPKEKP